MKKSVFFIVTAALLFSYSCKEFSEYEAPESVSVKTGAKFDIPVGSGKISMKEKAGIDKMSEILSDNMSDGAVKPSIYDYNPTKNEKDVLQYIINYPLKEIEFSIGDASSVPAIQDPDSIPDGTTVPVPMSLLQGSSATGSEETGLNFSTLLGDIFEGNDQDLSKNIDFADSDDAKFSAYIFISKPWSDGSNLDNLRVTGKIWASSDNSTTPKYFVGSESSNATVELKNSHLTFAQAAAENMITTTEVFKMADGYENYSQKVQDGTIVDLFNEKPENLKLEYNLSFVSTDGDGSTISLDKEAVKQLKSGMKVFISVAIVLPMQIKFKDVTDGAADGKIKINDLVSMFKSKDDDDEEDEEEDLLKRDSAEKSEDWVKYAEALKTCAFTYDVVNTMILNASDAANGTDYKKGEPLNISLTFYDSGKTSFAPKKMDSTDGNHIFAIEKEEMKKVFKEYPFNPKVRAEIPADGSVKIIPRDSAYSIGGFFTVEFDRDVSVEVWSK